MQACYHRTRVPYCMQLKTYLYTPDVSVFMCGLRPHPLLYDFVIEGRDDSAGRRTARLEGSARGYSGYSGYSGLDSTMRHHISSMQRLDRVQTTSFGSVNCSFSEDGRAVPRACPAVELL